MSTSIKMTGEELQKLVTQSFPVILASVVFVGIVIVDFVFSTTLQAFEENAKFGISFPGMEQGISFGSFMDESAVEAVLKVQAFNLSTDPCLPRSRQTGGSSLGPIFAVLFACLLSCLIDAYFSRVRAQICNLFFPFRADERAKYLFKYIFSQTFCNNDTILQEDCVGSKIPLLPAELDPEQGAGQEEEGEGIFPFRQFLAFP